MSELARKHWRAIILSSTGCPLPNIGSVGNDGAKDSTAHEADDEQDCNVIHLEAVGLVESVQVWTL